MTVIDKTAEVKNFREDIDYYNNQSIQELEQRLEELELEENSYKTKNTSQSSKEKEHRASVIYKKYFKLKLFSREAVESLAIGAVLSGALYTQHNTRILLSKIITQGTLNLLMYNYGVPFHQRLMINLLAYPQQSLGWFFNSKHKVDFNPQPIRVDPVSFKIIIDHIREQISSVIKEEEAALRRSIDTIPLIARKSAENIVAGIMYESAQYISYSYGRRLKNEIQKYIELQISQNKECDLMYLIDFIWKERVRTEFSATDKESLYKELLKIVDTPLNQNREQLILLIGYVAIHDPDIQNINRKFWSLSWINHTKNIIESIPLKEIFVILNSLNYKAIYHKLSNSEYSDMLLLPPIVDSITDIESSWQLPKVAFLVAATSIALLLFSKNFQYLPVIRPRLSSLIEKLTKETVGFIALNTIIVTAAVVVAYQQQLSNEELSIKLKDFQNHDSPAEIISYLYKTQATNNLASSTITSDDEIEEKKQQYQLRTQKFRLW